MIDDPSKRESLMPPREEGFTEQQIENIQSEFDRQRRWIKTLSEKESWALSELERTHNSVSYRIGRFLTWPLRKAFGGITGNKDVPQHDENEIIGELFPPLLISPSLVPETRSTAQGSTFVQELLLTLRKRRLVVGEIRDAIILRSYGMDYDTVFNCLNTITRYMIQARSYRSYVNDFYVGAFRALVLTDEVLAKKYYDVFSEVVKDQRADKTMVTTLMKMGHMRRPHNILKSMPRDSWTVDMMSQIEAQLNLLEKGFSGEVYFERDWKPNKGVVLYCAAQTLPHMSSGYAIRTHGIAKSLKKIGREVIVCSRHGYPVDRSDFKGEYLVHENEIDGVPYKFNPSNKDSGKPEIEYTDVFNFTRFVEYQSICTETLNRQMGLYKPEIVHAASNFVVGMAAVNSARALGIPSIYEVRGFWHISQESKRLGYLDSDHYTLSESMEVEVASRADHVFTITRAIADILTDYGIDEKKISILPNSVDTDVFFPIIRDSKLEEEFEMFDKVVVGYIGSFVEYEGLDLLLEAIGSVREEVGEYLKVMLVGDGPELDELKEMAKSLDIEDIVIFTGRVRHDETRRYYSLIDIATFPRKGKRVCELVSPLKPFEAMAMKIAVISSNVQALTEIVEDGVTGLLHEKDDANSLADCIKKLVLDYKLRDSLAEAGMKWVKENRSWETVARRITNKYDELVKNDSR